MTIHLQQTFETDTAGLTLSATGVASVARAASGAISGGYGLRAVSDFGEAALATADGATAVPTSGRYVAGCLLRPSAADEDVVVMANECATLWMLDDGSLRLDILSGRAGSTRTISSITSAAAAMTARRGARVVVEIVRDSADGDDDGQARLWLDGALVGELTGIDLWITAASLATATGCDRSRGEYRFVFDEAYASDQQIVNLGSATDDVTAYRNAVYLDGINDYAPLGFLPTDDTTVEMTFIPTVGAAEAYFFGNLSLAIGQDASGNVLLNYRGASDTGAAIVDATVQTWRVVCDGTTATLYIDDVQAAQVTGASAVFETDPPFVGAIGDGAAGASFAEMDLLELTFDNGTDSLHYTCHENTVDATDILDQDNSWDSTVVGALLKEEAASTHDVCLDDGYLCAATTVLENPVGTPVQPFTNGADLTLALDYHVPAGSVTEGEIFFGLPIGTSSQWNGIGTTSVSLTTVYVSNGTIREQAVFFSTGTARSRVVVVYKPATSVVSVFRNGSKLVDYDASGLSGTWPTFNAGAYPSTSHNSTSKTKDPKLKVYEAVAEARAWTDAEAIAWSGAV